MAKSVSQTNNQKSQTGKKQPLDGTKSLTWSIRNIDMETRSIFTKAADLHGKTISQYMLEDLRAFAQGQIQQTRQPATAQDLDNQVNVATLIERLEKLESRLDKPLWKRIFS